jgi:hypothetical protein
MRWSLRMNILLITDEVDSKSVLPGLPLQFRAVARRRPWKPQQLMSRSSMP